MRALKSYLLAILAMPIAGLVLADEANDHGVRAGPLIITPSFAIEQRYDTNVLLSAAGATESYFVSAAPRIEIRTDWNRHALKLEAGARAGFFTHDDDDNFLDFDALLGGQIDVTRAARVTIEADVQRNHERRGSVDTPGLAAEPTIYLETGLALRGDIAFRAIRFSPFAFARMLDFDDVALGGGGTANEDDRDRLVLGGGLEIGYRATRAIEGFLRTTFEHSDYDARTDDTGVDRDSDTITVDGGVKVRLSRLIDGTASAGVTHRIVQDPTLNDVTTAFADIGLLWGPTPRLTVQLDLNREIRETTLAQSGAVKTTEAELLLRYELLRTVGLQGAARAGHLNFDGITRSDRLFGGTLAADWALTRHIELEGGYEIDLRSSRAAGLGYTAHRLFLDARYRF